MNSELRIRHRGCATRLRNILNYRYNENKVTILMTKYKDDEERKNAKVGITDTLSERIGVRMRSRLYEMCKTIKMDGK